MVSSGGCEEHNNYYYTYCVTCIKRKEAKLWRAANNGLSGGIITLYTHHAGGKS